MPFPAARHNRVAVKEDWQREQRGNDDREPLVGRQRKLTGNIKATGRRSYRTVERRRSNHTLNRNRLPLEPNENKFMIWLRVKLLFLQACAISEFTSIAARNCGNLRWLEKYVKSWRISGPMVRSESVIPLSTDAVQDAS